MRGIKTLCLIGSTRFKPAYELANHKLSCLGYVVHTVESFKGHGLPISSDEKEILDLVHLRKIAASDAVVLITDSDMYIGESTRREIKWAKLHELSIFRWDMIHEGLDAKMDIFVQTYPNVHKAPDIEDSRNGTL